jgi:hypothetical protein
MIWMLIALAGGIGMLCVVILALVGAGSTDITSRRMDER